MAGSDPVAERRVAAAPAPTVALAFEALGAFAGVEAEAGLDVAVAGADAFPEPLGEDEVRARPRPDLLRLARPGAGGAAARRRIARRREGFRRGEDAAF